MKRSQIDNIIEKDIDFICKLGFRLPPFAFWSFNDWKTNVNEYSDAKINGLGWDISDYGFNDFYKQGIVALTIRSGNENSLDYKKPYAEKLLVLEPNQECPMHFHPNKIEDLINRGGGDFLIKLYNASDDNNLSDTPVEVLMDGRKFTINAGQIIRVKPGESITLKPRQYHTFWADDSKVLFGEVTMNDNEHYFYGTSPSPTIIEEDTPKKYLLTDEYGEI